MKLYVSDKSRELTNRRQLQPHRMGAAHHRAGANKLRFYIYVPCILPYFL